MNNKTIILASNNQGKIKEIKYIFKDYDVIAIKEAEQLLGKELIVKEDPKSPISEIFRTLRTNIQFMNVNKKLNGSVLEVAVEGRIDTTTAPKLEAELKESCPDAESVVLDFAAVDYISSAGLRVLLSVQKLMSKRGGMKLTHVSDDIMEIFEVTGFNEILTIE